MPIALEVQDQVLVGPREEAEAGQFLQDVAASGVSLQGRGPRHLRLVAAEPAQAVVAEQPPAEVELPEGLRNLLVHVIEAVASGKKITVTSFPEELTTTVAAGVLGISRPTLMKWISEGKIAAHKVGSHSRLKTEDVLELERQMNEKQSRAIDEMWELSNELGV